jgi:hypothetical protein
MGFSGIVWRTVVKLSLQEIDMGDLFTMAFGGKTDAQKDLERQQKKTAADALATKVTAIQDTVGSRTRELVARYGVGSGGLSGVAASGGKSSGGYRL